MESLPYYLSREHAYRFDRDRRYERIYPGVYRPKPTTSTQGTPIGADAAALHETKIRAIAEKLSPRITISHTSAARMYGFTLPINHNEVHAYQQFKSSADNSKSLIRHTTKVAVGKAQLHRGVRVTDPIRTVIDCVRMLPIADALILTDSAMRILSGVTRWNQAEAMKRHQKIQQRFHSYLDSMTGMPHILKARAIVFYASPLSDSPYESQLRLLILQAGLPQPRVQPQLSIEGKSAFPDLLLSDPAQKDPADPVPAYGPTVVEFDGAVKYITQSPPRAEDLRASKDFPAPSETTLLKEKRREDALRRAGYNVVRFTASDLTISSAPMRQLLQLVPKEPNPNPMRLHLHEPPQLPKV